MSAIEDARELTNRISDIEMMLNIGGAGAREEGDDDLDILALTVKDSAKRVRAIARELESFFYATT